MVLANQTPTQWVRDAATEREQPGLALEDTTLACAPLDEGAQTMLAVKVGDGEVSAHSEWFYVGLVLGYKVGDFASNKNSRYEVLE